MDVAQLRQALPPRERNALVLVGRGWLHADVAKQLKITVAEVGELVEQARTRIEAAVARAAEADDGRRTRRHPAGTLGGPRMTIGRATEIVQDAEGVDGSIEDEDLSPAERRMVDAVGDYLERDFGSSSAGGSGDGRARGGGGEAPATTEPAGVESPPEPPLRIPEPPTANGGKGKAELLGERIIAYLEANGPTLQSELNHLGDGRTHGSRGVAVSVALRRLEGLQMLRRERQPGMRSNLCRLPADFRDPQGPDDPPEPEPDPEPPPEPEPERVGLEGRVQLGPEGPAPARVPYSPEAAGEPQVEPPSRIVALVYLLLRDELPMGRVMRHVEAIEGMRSDVELHFTNEHLRALAESIVDRVG